MLRGVVFVACTIKIELGLRCLPCFIWILMVKLCALFCLINSVKLVVNYSYDICVGLFEKFRFIAVCLLVCEI